MRHPPVSTAQSAAATLAALLLALLAGSRAQAAEEHPLAPPRPLTVTAARLAAAPRMDGRLEEWAEVGPAATLVLDRRAHRPRRGHHGDNAPGIDPCGRRRRPGR